MERYLSQHLIHDVLDRLPERANRAIDRVRAEFCHPGVQAAKTGLEETSTKPGQHLTDIDVIRRSRQLVSTGLTADTLTNPPRRSERISLATWGIDKPSMRAISGIVTLPRDHDVPLAADTGARILPGG